MSDDRTRAAELADELDRSIEFYDLGEVPEVSYDMSQGDARLIVAALRAYAATQKEAAGDDAEIGRSIVATIGAHVGDPSSPLFEWAPAERYDEVIGDLVEMIVAAREARISPPQDLREMVEQAFRVRNGCENRRHCTRIGFDRGCACVKDAGVSLSAIHAAGYAIVPREPSAAAVAPCCEE